MEQTEYQAALDKIVAEAKIMPKDKQLDYFRHEVATLKKSVQNLEHFIVERLANDAEFNLTGNAAQLFFGLDPQ